MKPEKTSRFSHTSIFDLDHTLCTGNTSFRFGIYLLSARFLPVYKMPFLMGCYLCHKLGLMSMSKLHQEACHHFFQGKSMPDLIRHVENFLDLHLLDMLNAEIIALLDEAKSKGHYTVLLSSSPDFLVGEIARRMEFHEWAGTEYSLREDRTIGEIGMLMEGEHKALYVRDLMNRMEFCKNKITAYSDSFLDLPFLEAAGNPIAVNPDKKLRKISLHRKWKII